MKYKVMSIFGTRPEASKMGPLIDEMKTREEIETIVCVTAQHRQMLDSMLDIFRIVPDYDLNIMQAEQTLTNITTRVLLGIEAVLRDARPDMVLVHGDTTTTFASALSAFYAGIPVGHVEAGLRTYDKKQPYPEEVNRMLTTSLAELYFAPTSGSKENLLKENVPSEKIFVTGNTAVDCLKYSLSDNYIFSASELSEIDFKNRRVIAMTAHRGENLGKPLENICHAVKQLVEENSDIEVVYAVHLNPAVQKTARAILGSVPRVHLVNPPNMLDMHNLMLRSYMILTDSGGLQEEGAGLHRPVVVLRNVTERPEGLAAGTLTIAGNETEGILRESRKLLHDKDAYERMSNAKNPYGDGNAAIRITDAILYRFGANPVRPEDFN